jgi:DNA replicative helicase MCM subunit Mcm2 (Cdc46/Mcm family)
LPSPKAGKIVGSRESTDSGDALHVSMLTEAHVNTPVTVLARVVEADTKKISIQVAVFRCSRCGRMAEEVQTTEQLKFPLACSPSWGGCGAKRREARFKMMEKESLYAARQVVLLADLQEDDRIVSAVLRGPLAGSVPIGAQANFRGRLKPRTGRSPRGQLPYTIEVAAITDVRMPDRVVLYPRKVDPQIIFNIVIELQRAGQPTNYKVVVDEARKIGLAEEDVRAMLNKLLSEGKIEGKEKERQASKGADGEEDKEKEPK